MNGFDHALLYAFLAAFGGGLLVGIERERDQGAAAERSAAGVRTFTLAAVSGLVAALLGAAAVGVGIAATAALAFGSYQRSREHDPGLTSEVTLVLVFLLGALAHTQAQLAAALFVATAILLESKQTLHRFTRQALTDAELGDLLLLAASALIVLPLLPDRTVDPFGVLNPRMLWLLVVLVMAINAAGYIALRALGARRGLLLAGFLGGFVSSTATIAGMGQRARATPGAHRPAVAAALLSNVPTVIQLGVVIGALAPDLVRALLPALGVGGAVAALVALAYGLRAGLPASPHELAHSGSRPFDIRHALLFAAIMAVALLSSAVLHRWIGDGGVTLAAAAAALADVHAAAASIGQLSAQSGLSQQQALLAVGAAFAANSVTKCVAAFGSGGLAFGRPLLIGLLLVNLAFLGTLALDLPRG
ncbi:MAG: DUF4010 domain-containing protein [Lysobacteraceae bacterium]|nr:MAG: DUF4010 domain-containing protein [Xanthomonadaceae bacterium]